MNAETAAALSALAAKATGSATERLETNTPLGRCAETRNRMLEETTTAQRLAWKTPAAQHIESAAKTKKARTCVTTASGIHLNANHLMKS